MSASRIFQPRNEAVPIGEAPLASAEPAADYGVSDFLEMLFSALEDAGIQYCVLHGWDGLPEVLPSDLDLAVHPKDRDKLSGVFGKMRDLGFLPIDCHNYEVNAQTFYFCWFRGLERRSIAIDIIFEYRGRGTVILTGLQLTAARRRQRSFWIPDSTVALRYMLAKRALKKHFTAYQQQQIKRLLFELGMPSAGTSIASVFGKGLKERVVEAALGDRLNDIAGELATAMKRNAIRNKPADVVRCLADESLRLFRRFLRPTGLLVAVMGPDGAGKSTVVQAMMEREWLEFQSRSAFHWRPQVVGKRPDLGPLADPHGRPTRGSFGSILRLAGCFADYWLGYVFVIRPRLVRSGLVIFDRYFDDITVDSTRYRYGGPAWLPKLLTHLVPRPDLVVMLDADVESVLARKREVSETELTALRGRYAQFADRAPNGVTVKTGDGLAPTSAGTLHALTDRMNRRFEHRHKNWIAQPQSRPV